MSNLKDSYKGLKDNNPIINQHFGADPYALIYEGRVYIYMTADKYEYGEGGEMIENTYSQIHTIYVVSTDDMVNFTDHGEINCAGPDGAAKWARNSWAPAAAWKMIDGKPKFFLYFADSANGIGVLSSDSPVGPFVDEIGHPLISRDMNNCSDIVWLFDPAVLVDDDGEGYIYFGGGVPEGNASHPKTSRCAKLGSDMMSIVGDPVTIDAPYVFEDSGIHKFGGKYYYTYCSNFNVDEAGTREYGFTNGQIISMEGDGPLGPFTLKEMILRNPEDYWKLGGNNHHCVFNFNGQWYMTYHSRLLEKEMNLAYNYRCVHIDEFTMGEDGTIGLIEQTLNARRQIKPLDPYKDINGACFALVGGANPAPADDVSAKYGCGNLLLSDISDGCFVKLAGVGFGNGNKGAASVSAVVRGTGNGKINVIADDINNSPLCTIEVNGGGADSVFSASVASAVTGTHDIFFVFEGSGYEIVSWKFA